MHDALLLSSKRCSVVPASCAVCAYANTPTRRPGCRTSAIDLWVCRVQCAFCLLFSFIVAGLKFPLLLFVFFSNRLSSSATYYFMPLCEFFCVVWRTSSWEAVFNDPALRTTHTWHTETHTIVITSTPCCQTFVAVLGCGVSQAFGN